MLDDLLRRFRTGDRLALSRLTSLVGRGEQVQEILAGVGEPARAARVVALTGSGGVGKSTLTGRLIAEIRRKGDRVAVLACDPESPITGGALLGDRFRMPARPDDDGLFIRSLAAAGGQGALALHLAPLIRLMEAAGFGVILLETVGAGQGDTAVVSLGDVVVLLLQPETGDDLQWEKAGLLEVADVVVLNKADLPGAERVEAQVLATLALSSHPAPPVLRVSSRTGEGVDKLWEIVAGLPLKRGRLPPAQDLLRLAQAELAARYQAAQSRGDKDLTELVTKFESKALPAAQAGASLLRLLAERGRNG
jgi:LAO/AO transport system kinase